MRDAGHRTPDAGHRTAKKAKIIYPPPRGVDINRYKAKTPNRLFDESSLIHKRGGGGGGGGGGQGGQGVNLTSYLDSSHKVSQYLSIHSKTLKE